MELEVFYDYRCPYVYQAAVLLRRVSASGQRNLRVRWRYFSLTQVNNQQDGWTIWDAPAADRSTKGRLAFQAAEAAREQDRFEALHNALLEARHLDRLNLDDRTVIEDVAGRAGLDLVRFRRDLDDPSALQAIARDHQEAAGELGVFGTPTVHLPGRGAAYLRVRPAPEGQAAVRLFDQVMAMMVNPHFLELKRARLDPAPATVSRPAAETREARTSGSLRPGS